MKIYYLILLNSFAMLTNDDINSHVSTPHHITIPTEPIAEENNDLKEIIKKLQERLEKFEEQNQMDKKRIEKLEERLQKLEEENQKDKINSSDKPFNLTNKKLLEKILTNSNVPLPDIADSAPNVKLQAIKNALSAKTDDEFAKELLKEKTSCEKEMTFLEALYVQSDFFYKNCKPKTEPMAHITRNGKKTEEKQEKYQEQEDFCSKRLILVSLIERETQSKKAKETNTSKSDSDNLKKLFSISNPTENKEIEELNDMLCSFAYKSVFAISPYAIFNNFFEINCIGSMIQKFVERGCCLKSCSGLNEIDEQINKIYRAENISENTKKELRFLKDILNCYIRDPYSFKRSLIHNLYYNTSLPLRLITFLILFVIIPAVALFSFIKFFSDIEQNI